MSKKIAGTLQCLNLFCPKGYLHIQIRMDLRLIQPQYVTIDISMRLHICLPLSVTFRGSTEFHQQ